MTRNEASPLASLGALSPSQDRPRATSVRVTSRPRGAEVSHQSTPASSGMSSTWVASARAPPPASWATRCTTATARARETAARRGDGGACRERTEPLEPLPHPDFLRITRLAVPFDGHAEVEGDPR